jgi:hypothetical protein
MVNFSLLLSTYLTFVKAFFTHVFYIKKVNAFNIAVYNLFSPSFRISQTHRVKNTLVFSLFKKVCFNRNKNAHHFVSESQTKSGKYIFDGSIDSYQERKEFCNFFLKEKIEGGIFKSTLCYLNNPLDYCLYFFYSIFFVPILFFKTLFIKDKAPYALLVMEILESYQLLRICKKLKVKELYYFNIFEKDSNINALLLEKANIKVIKITSEVPLAIWNNRIIADKICLCSAYQFEEINYFKETMFFKEIEMWGPEKMMFVKNLYDMPLFIKSEQKTLGFYSTGAWLRKLNNDIDQGFNMTENEELLKVYLKEYCYLRPEVKLQIFLHPREKKSEVFDRTKEYYNETFKGITFDIINSTNSTSESFQLSDIAVAFNSTIMYERLYFGFKSILMPLSFKNFPIKNSSLSNICVYNKDELFSKLDNSFVMSPKKFFEFNRLEVYENYKREYSN